AIQFVPAIAPHVAHMTIFQRTPGWVVPKSDKPYSDRTRRLYERAPWLQKAVRQAMWTMMEATVPVFTRRPRWAATAGTIPFRVLSAMQRRSQLRGDERLLEAAPRQRRARERPPSRDHGTRRHRPRRHPARGRHDRLRDWLHRDGVPRA